MSATGGVVRRIEPPFATEIRTIASPSFQAPYPRIEHKARIPADRLAQRQLRVPDIGFLVPDLVGGSAEVVPAALGLLGIGSPRLLARGNDPVFCKENILIDGLTEHGQYMSPLVLRCLDELATPISPGTAARIYVGRASAAMRRLRNEEALRKIFDRHGYEAVDPGECRSRSRWRCSRAPDPLSESGAPR